MANPLSRTSLWVFGYGSLCWQPGFPVSASCIGYVKDYVRRFWQGNTSHRGVPGKPGRVATLVREDEGVTWGVAYEIRGEDALDYLNDREVAEGGYATEIATFFPRDEVNSNPFPVLVYIATPVSREWVGPAPLHTIADQIICSSGPRGHNVEYLLRLAEFMRENIPDGYDYHLATLEALVRQRIKENNLCLGELMGEAVDTLPGRDSPVLEPEVADGAADLPLHQEARGSHHFSDNLPKKKLRCVNV